MKKYFLGFVIFKNLLDVIIVLFYEKDMIVGLLYIFEKDDSVGFIMVGVNIRDEENEMYEIFCKVVSEVRE